ncbi:hypothetical protein SAMN05421755_101023 [Nitrosomonas sp. Nm33]|nr:hypothetical protein SAMN05421755_101023 [Nitrosomonas sp. Nm33]
MMMLGNYSLLGNNAYAYNLYPITINIEKNSLPCDLAAALLIRSRKNCIKRFRLVIQTKLEASYVETIRIQKSEKIMSIKFDPVFIFYA